MPNTATAFLTVSLEEAISVDPISAAYELMSVNPEFLVRHGQESLSRHVRALANGEIASNVLLAEAPTGTGKTLGCMIGCTVGSRETGWPIVYATATVALQSQIMKHDIPQLVEAGLITSQEVVLMKGRARYFCPQLAAGVKEDKRDATGDLFAEKDEADTKPKSRDIPIVMTMLKKWREKKWSGEIDEWTGREPDIWSAVASDSNTCTKKACPYHDECPYLAARARASLVSMLVVNHSIVFSDLAMRDEAKREGKDIEANKTLIPFDKYIVVFDEGHKLPDGASDTKTFTTKLKQDWLHCVSEYADEAMALPAVAAVVAELEGTLTPGPLLAKLAKLHTVCLSLSIAEGDNQYKRFNHRKLPVDLEQACKEAHNEAYLLASTLHVVNKSLGTEIKVITKAQGKVPVGLVTLLSNGSGMVSAALRLVKGLEAFYTQAYLVTSVARSGEDFSLDTSPIEGAEVLDDLLWHSGMKVVIISATLRSMGKFDAFKRKAGVPTGARELVMGHVLPYEKSELVLTCKFTTDSQHKNYVRDLAREIALRIVKDEGTLVLFTNRKVMEEVAAYMAESRWVRDNLPTPRVQFTVPIPKLVAEHKAAIDTGFGSVLFGVDSFAEGLDLPGDYCSHVLVTKLPFGVPGGPREEAREAINPERYFRDKVLPEMEVKLVQAAGRLVRRESDAGRITILDARMLTTSYGRKMVNHMPPFKVINEAGG